MIALLVCPKGGQADAIKFLKQEELLLLVCPKEDRLMHSSFLSMHPLKKQMREKRKKRK